MYFQPGQAYADLQMHLCQRSPRRAELLYQKQAPRTTFVIWCFKQQAALGKETARITQPDGQERVYPPDARLSSNAVSI